MILLRCTFEPYPEGAAGVCSYRHCWGAIFCDLLREERRRPYALPGAHKHRADDHALPGTIASPQHHESCPHGVYKRTKNARLEQSVCIAARRLWIVSVARIGIV